MMYHHEEKSNLARIGIAMYGVDTAGEESVHLKQVMSLYSRVVMIKKIKKGEKIGYGLTYTAPEDEYIATGAIDFKVTDDKGYYQFNDLATCGLNDEDEMVLYAYRVTVNQDNLTEGYGIKQLHLHH